LIIISIGITQGKSIALPKRKIKALIKKTFFALISLSYSEGKSRVLTD